MQPLSQSPIPLSGNWGIVVAMPKQTIIRNSAKCRNCGEVIQSFHLKDYVECKCGAIAIDGGTRNLLRHIDKEIHPDPFEDTSIVLRE